MVLFLGGVRTNGCGDATSASGPFYWQADEYAYLDDAFLDVLASQQFRVGGDFAQAYVVAHHVLTVTGVSGEVRQRQSSAGSQQEVNALTIRLEFWADCLAGTWANAASRRPATAEVSLEVGDIAEGIRAAEVVGDDRIQAKAGQQVTPHSWTHGSTEQRQAWFMLGVESATQLCASAHSTSLSPPRRSFRFNSAGLKQVRRRVAPTGTASGQPRLSASVAS